VAGQRGARARALAHQRLSRQGSRDRRGTHYGAPAGVSSVVHGDQPGCDLSLCSVLHSSCSRSLPARLSGSLLRLRIVCYALPSRAGLLPLSHEEHVREALWVVNALGFILQIVHVLSLPHLITIRCSIKQAQFVQAAHLTVLQQ
jgi:hypothetical protein